jgi:hypothetical protein
VRAGSLRNTNPPLALRLLVSLRFQVLFHSPQRGTFHLSLTVLVHYRSPSVFSLGRWTSRIPTGLACPAVLRCQTGVGAVFVYGTLTLFGWLSHTILLTVRFVTPQCLVLQPQSSKLGWFGLFPVRSPLLGELFLFLWVLRCFSSPGAPYHPIYSDGNAIGSQ